MKVCYSNHLSLSETDSTLSIV